MYTVLIDRPETVVDLKSSIHVLHLFMFSAIMYFYFDTLVFTFSLRKADTPCKLVFSLFSSQYEQFCSTVGPYAGTGNFTVSYYSVHGSHFCEYSFQYIEVHYPYRSMHFLVSKICMYLVSSIIFSLPPDATGPTRLVSHCVLSPFTALHSTARKGHIQVFLKLKVGYLISTPYRN